MLFSKVAIFCSVFLYFSTNLSLSYHRLLLPFPELFISVVVFLKRFRALLFSADLISLNFASANLSYSLCSFPLSLDGTNPIAFHLSQNALIAEIFSVLSSLISKFCNSASNSFFKRIFSSYFKRSSS